MLRKLAGLWFFLLTVLPLGPSSLQASVVSGKTGTLVTNQTTTGATANCIDVSSAGALVVLFYGTAGTLSVSLQNCVEATPDACDAHTTWITVTGSTQTTVPTSVAIMNPVGCCVCLRHRKRRVSDRSPSAARGARVDER